MAVNLGKMTAQAVLDASQFTAGLQAVTGTAAKAKAAIGQSTGAAGAAFGDMAAEGVKANAAVQTSLNDVIKANKKVGKMIKGIGTLMGGGFLGTIISKSVAKLHDEAKADLERIQAGGAVGQRSEFLREFETASKSLNFHLDDVFAKVVIGLGRIREGVSDFLGLGGNGPIGALTREEGERRTRQQQQLRETAAFNSLFSEDVQSGIRTPRLLAADLIRQSNSRTGLTNDELQARSISRQQSRTESIRQMQLEFVALQQNADERQRTTLALQGATEAEIAHAEVIRRGTEEIRTQQRYAADEAALALRQSDQATTPMERFRMAMADIDRTFGLDIEQRARLAAQAFEQLNTTLGRIPSLGNLGIGSQAVAEILTNRDREERNAVVDVLRAGQEMERQQNEANREVLLQIRGVLGSPDGGLNLP